jgi:hypothetical protein
MLIQLFGTNICETLPERLLDILLHVAMCYTYGGYTLLTLPHILTPYRDSVDGTRDRVTYQKLVTR